MKHVLLHKASLTTGLV